MLNEIKIVIKWAKENNETFNKMIKKDLWMIAHPKIWKFANKVKDFGNFIIDSKDEKVIDILVDIYYRFPTEEEATAELLTKYIEYQAKTGSVEAAKYIRFANRHLGGLRNYCMEGVRAFEKLEDLIAEV